MAMRYSGCNEINVLFIMRYFFRLGQRKYKSLATKTYLHNEKISRQWIEHVASM